VQKAVHSDMQLKQSAGLLPRLSSCAANRQRFYSLTTDFSDDPLQQHHKEYMLQHIPSFYH